MTRTLFGMMFALSLFFVTGCGSSTETTLIEVDPAASEAEDAAYEEQMDSEEEEEGDEEETED